MTVIHAETKRWTVQEYRQMWDIGLFKQGERVELIEGEIVRMPPQDSPHRQGMALATRVLVLAFNPTHYIVPTVDVELNEWSSPEPDFVVMKQSELQNDKLTSGELFVEVSDTSLRYDRLTKSSLYAKSRIPEYWILNVCDRQLEVHRDPGPDSKAPCKHAYRTVTILRSGATVNPLCRPDVSIAVADLVPP